MSTPTCDVTMHKMVVPYSSNVCENSLVQWNVWIHRLPRENVSTMSPALVGRNFSSVDILLTFTLCQCNVMTLLNNLSGTGVWTNDDQGLWREMTSSSHNEQNVNYHQTCNKSLPEPVTRPQWVKMPKLSPCRFNYCSKTLHRNHDRIKCDDTLIIITNRQQWIFALNYNYKTYSFQYTLARWTWIEWPIYFCRYCTMGFKKTLSIFSISKSRHLLKSLCMWH